MMREVLLDLLPVVCLVLLGCIAVCIILTVTRRSMMARRRVLRSDLRGRARSLLTSLMVSEEDPVVPDELKRMSRSRWRREVLVEAARSLAGDVSVRARVEHVMSEAGIMRHVRRQVSSASPFERADASEVIGDLHLMALLPDLYVLMRDKDMATRLAAASAFAQMSPETSAVALVRMLLSERVPVARQRLAELLAGLGPQAASALLEAFEKSPAPLFSALVARCCPMEKALPALVDATECADPLVRLEAVRALGDVGTSWALPALLNATGDPDAFVRSAAATTLGRVGDPAAIPTLAALLGDLDHVVRQRAASACLLLDGGSSVLTDVVLESDSPAARLAASVALQQHLATSGASLLAHPDSGVRLQAERSVRALLNVQGFFLLAVSLSVRHPNPEVRSRLGVLLDSAPARTAVAGDPKVKVVLPGERTAPPLANNYVEIRRRRRPSSAADAGAGQ